MNTSPELIEKIKETLIAKWDATLSQERDQMELLQKQLPKLTKIREAASEKCVENNPVIDDVFAWQDEIPEDATPKQIAALIMYVRYVEAGTAHFTNIPDIEAELSGFIGPRTKADPDFIAAIETEMQKIAAPMIPALENEMTVKNQYKAMQLMNSQEAVEIDFVLQKPEQDGGDWTVVVLPVKIKNGRSSIPETVPFDVYFSGYVSSTDPSLKNQFNVASARIEKGQKVEPFVVTTKAPEEYKTIFRLNGHIQDDGGAMQPLSLLIPVTDKQEPPKQNMNPYGPQ